MLILILSNHGVERSRIHVHEHLFLDKLQLKLFLKGQWKHRDEITQLGLLFLLLFFVFLLQSQGKVGRFVEDLSFEAYATVLVMEIFFDGSWEIRVFILYF